MHTNAVEKKLTQWFYKTYLLPKPKTQLQKILGILAIINSILGSITNLFLGYYFGKELNISFLSLQGSSNLGLYFAITAFLPLACLMSITAYNVTQALADPKNLESAILLYPHSTIKERLDKIIILILAALSSIPYAYITYKHLFHLLYPWSILITTCSFIGPMIVNNWALNACLLEFKKFFYFIRNRYIKVKEEYQYIQNIVLKIFYTLDVLNTEEIRVFYLKFKNDEPEKKALPRLLQLANYPHPPLYLITKALFGILGATIAAVSAYPYYSNGIAAGKALSFPEPLVHLLGWIALICNSALAAYTSKVIFSELYYQLYQRLSARTTTAIPLKPITMRSWMLLASLSIIAFSAAVPNLYLTLESSKELARNLLTYSIMVCSFLGPFIGNFFALRQIIEQHQKKFILRDILTKLLSVCPYFKSEYRQDILQLYKRSK